ncbi:MAG TPA: SPOR domain-containing protein [Woeseiaceae bacterium]|nr:SPOR domain-containing protein [Woeseiaceae bacterium]
MARRRGSAGRRTGEFPGWAWMLFGLAIGLSVALAIYVNGREMYREPQPVAQQPASLNEPVKDEMASEEAPAGAAAEVPPSRFEFYDMLPNFEVIIPEAEKEVSTDTSERAVVTPGVYVLQVGSFTEFADADRRRAQLALQGIESVIQRVRIDDKTYHRVRIGPIEDLERLNVLRSRLREANMDALRIRLSE